MTEGSRVGRLIKARMKVCGYTDESLASELSVSVSYITHIQKDPHLHGVSVQFFTSLCQALSTTPNNLLGFDSEKVLVELREKLRMIKEIVS